MTDRMKKSLFRLLLFLMPLALYVAPPAYVLWRSKENFHSPEKELSAKEPYRIGYAYHECNYNWIKWKSVSAGNRNTVMALGSSRVLQFRRQMFTGSFYNAGYTVSSARDFVPFLKSIPKEKLPDYLIISLDQWMFNSNWDKCFGKVNPDRWAKAFRKNPDLSVINHVWHDLFSKKYGLEIRQSDAQNHLIGLNAAVNGKGFRNDGSMDYGQQISSLLKDTVGHYSDTYERIATGTNRFQYASEINPAAVSEVEKLLAFCRKNHIKAIAFLPPYGDAVYQKMQASGRYAYLHKIVPALSPLFEKYGFELYNFSTAASCGSNDGETIDGFHGSETTALKMLVKMLESGSALNKVADKAKLEADLARRQDRYEIYP